MEKGLFIVLEGVEGAGKSTQARLLAGWLEGLGLPFTLAREPGGTPVGEAIRGIVLDRDGLRMPPETELFLILGARAAFVDGVVRPALGDGRIVLADRFDFSTFAYQGYGRGLDLARVKDANDMATGGLVPDLYLILDLPVEVGVGRKGGVEAGDRIEQEGTTFLSRVRAGYQALANESPLACVVDADATVEEVQSALRNILEERFPETFPTQGV